MKRAILPCLLLGLMALGTCATVLAETDFYMDVRVGSGYNRYPGQRHYPPNYQPYNELRQWLNYTSQRYRNYDRWWYQQSSYYRSRTRMQHDYGRQLYQDMRRYPNWAGIQRMEQFLRRYYDPYAYSYYGRDEYRDPYYGGGNYGNDYGYYPDNRYYDNAPRRQYYSDPYYYNRNDRESDYHAYGTGEGIGHIVRGSRQGNDLEVWSGALNTAGNILGIVNSERERDRDFGRYPDYSRYR